MHILIPSCLLLAFLLWRLVACILKWNHKDRLNKMRAQCRRSFPSVYAERVSQEAEQEPCRCPILWMRKAWCRNIAKWYFRDTMGIKPKPLVYEYGFNH